MSRSTAHALLLPGVGLLALAGLLLSLEPMAQVLAQLEPAERLSALGPTAAVVAGIAALAGAALRHAPRATWSRLLGAAVAGACAGLVIAAAAPQWLANGASPVALLR